MRAQERLRADLCNYLSWLKERVGYTGWRFDFAKGYYGSAVKVCARLEHLHHAPHGSYNCLASCACYGCTAVRS